MNWTDKQIEAIGKSGMNLLVSAAAGSGKTAVLVERVKRLILEEGVGVDELLVVTFTNAAAAEMKEKIFASLSRALSEHAGDPGEKQQLRQQLSLVGRANISTFHAFALEIVRRYYHVIGKAPGLALCDEARQSILKQEAMDDLFERSFERRDPDFIDFLDRYATAKSQETPRAMILSLHTFLQSLPEPWEWVESQRKVHAPGPASPDADPVVSHLKERTRRGLAWIEAYLEKATEILMSVKDERGEPCLKNLAAKNELDRALFQNLLTLVRQGRFSEAQSILTGGVSFARMAVGKDEKSWYDEGLKCRVNDLRSAAKKRAGKLAALWDPRDLERVSAEYAMAQPVLESLFRLVREFDGLYAKKKEQKNLLDFSDIEHFALDILRDPDVCREYRERFRYIFIDEYQDSNGVQDALIRKISRADNVFMVGDVKQSIYKFRLAEPELFIGKYLSYKESQNPGGGVVDLNSNFRSKGGIIDLVNRLFSAVMHPESTGLAYDSDAALIKGSPYEGPCDVPPVLYLVDTGEEEGEEAPDPEIAELKAAELEAIQAAAILRQQLGQPIHDDSAGRERPLEYRDMAILMRAVKGNGEIFYRALTDAGIPVFLDRNEGYFDTIEIQVFLNLLRLIDNRKQDIPLLSVLRSPIFGFSADDLAAVRILANRSGTQRTSYNEAFLYYARSGPCGSLKERCAAFLEKLDHWRNQATHLPLGDFIWALLIDTKYSLFVRAIPGGTQRQANLQALVDRAVAYENANFGGLYGFIRHVEFLAGRTGRIDTGQAGVLAEDANAVRIMTIHKSKGLEFPFVLLAGLAKRLGSHPNRLPLACHKNMGLGLRLTDNSKGIYADPLAYRMINDRIRQEDLAESIRILYVAMTRPKDRLVLLAAVPGPGNAADRAKGALPGDVESAGSYLDMILAAAGDAIPVRIVQRADLSRSRQEEQAGRERLREQLENGFSVPANKERPVEAPWTIWLKEPLPASQQPQEPVKLTVSQLSAMEAGSLPFLPRLASDEPEEEGWEAQSGEGPFVFRRPVFMTGEKPLTPAEKGTAYHNILERIPLSERYAQTEAVEGFLEGLAGKGILTPREAAEVDPGRISAFFRSRTGKRILAAPQVYREASFVMKTSFRGAPRLVQGTIDCCFMEGDRWVLVDYKSNYIDPNIWEEEKERMSLAYQTQMRLYKEALEKITKTPVREAILYLLAAGDQLTMTY